MIKQLSSLTSLSLPASVVAVGGFDGLHRGHQSLVKNMLIEAKELGVPSVMISFDPLPFLFFRQFEYPMNLVMPNERAELANALGIDYLITIPFDQSVADLSAPEFIQLLSTHLGMKSLWIGQDFSLGKNREGTWKPLLQLASIYHFRVQLVEKLQIDGQPVSSTRIRVSIRNGEVQKAWKLLGYPYFLKSPIVHGAALGRKLGIPTLNMKFPAEKVIPRLGVYTTYIWFGNTRYRAITSVGMRPTFYTDSEIIVETFILSDFSGTAPAEAKVEFLQFLRPEFKFNSAQELVDQIKKDAERATAFFQTIE